MRQKNLGAAARPSQIPTRLELSLATRICSRLGPIIIAIR